MRRIILHSSGLGLLLVVSLAFNVGFGTTFGVRTYRHYCRGSGNGACWQNLHEELNLTPEQECQIRAAKEKLFRQVGEFRQQLTLERERLAELLAALEPDRAAITLQLDKIAALQRMIQECVVEHLLEEKELLTPEQRGDLNEIIRRRICPRGAHGSEGGLGACGIRSGWGHGDDAPCTQQDSP